jgi:PAS domain S-box-containing protein
VACYVPLAVAGREQMRTATRPTRAISNTSDTLTRSLPYAAMLSAFLVLVYLTRNEIGGPAAMMTMVVFTLTLLLMVRQGVILRGDALVREKRAARMVEDRFASLIANASDVIMIVEADGALRFVSPACERTLGFKPEEVTGKNLLDVWAGQDGERLRALLTEIATTPSGTVGPVELAIERGTARYVLESVGSNLTEDPAVRGLALNFRDISERKALEEQLRQMAAPRGGHWARARRTGVLPRISAHRRSRYGKHRRDGEFKEAINSETKALSLAHRLKWDVTPMDDRMTHYTASQSWYGTLLEF